MDLKNCPFCNQQFRVNEINHTSGCYFSDPCDKSWNQRAEDPELTAAREVVEAARQFYETVEMADQKTSDRLFNTIEQYDKQRSGE